MPANIDTCFEALDNVQQLDALDQPCRTVVIVYSAWGIIQNGGFAYFFENNFPGDPPFEVFTQAFRQVGLEDIALRFSNLVAMFPFSDPHQSIQKREEFLSSQPGEFMAAMTELENLIYRHDNIEETLNSFLGTSP